MAQFSVNVQRFDPYKNFKFRVKWMAGMSRVSAKLGLKRTTEVRSIGKADPSTAASHRDGRSTSHHLERGVTHDLSSRNGLTKCELRGRPAGSVVKDFQGHHHRNAISGPTPLPTRLPLLGVRVSGATRSDAN